MGFKFDILQPEDRVILQVSSATENTNTIELEASVLSIARPNLLKIDIPYEGKVLNFNNTKINLLFYRDNEKPILWRNCMISYLNKQYSLATANEGVSINRRGCFRVGVSQPVIVKRQTRKNAKAILKDVSLTGFALTDRDNELQLSVGEMVTVYLADGGYDFSLTGHVVRQTQHEDVVTYGCEMSTSCKELSEYITVKQRRR